MTCRGRCQPAASRLVLLVIGICVALAGSPARLNAADWVLGDVFAGVAGGSYKVYSNSGVFKETISDGLGGFTTGCAFDSSFNLYTTNINNDKIVKYSGTHPHSILQTILTSTRPESIVFASDGQFYSGHGTGGGDIRRYNAAGLEQQSYDVGVDGLGSDWIDLAADQMTMFYTSEGRKIFRYNVSGAGSQLADFVTLPGTGAEGFQAFALRLLPPGDGTGGLLVADRANIKRLNSAGTVITTYDVGGEDFWFALNLDPNGTSFWAADVTTGKFYRFNIASGAIEVGPIDTAAPGNLFGLCVRGEPTAAANQPPVAVNDSYSVDEDTTLSVAAPGVLGNDTDPDGDPLSAVLVSAPSNGSLTLNVNGSFAYTPNANFNGTDSFKYKASDGTASSNEATVTITVKPVNDTPQAADGAASTTEDSLTGVTIDLATLVSDVETSDANLTYSIVSGPSNGTLSGSGASRTYVPNADFNGTDSFTYNVTDRGDPDNCGPPSSTCAATKTSATKTVTITVAPLNDTPQATDGTASTNEDTAVTIDLGTLVSDVETSDANLTYTIVSGPSNGTLSGSGASRTYVPNADFNGTDTFTYNVTDRGDPDNCAADPPPQGCAESLTSATKTVTITVAPVNDPPVFDAIPNQVDIIEPIPIDVIGVAPAMSPVPADEAGQKVTLSATSSDPTLVTNLTFDGQTLTYERPLATQGMSGGPVTITVTAMDDGGIANGGSDTYSQAFTITLKPDNCPGTPNPDQSDQDNDGVGDRCDTTPAGANAPPLVTARLAGLSTGAPTPDSFVAEVALTFHEGDVTGNDVAECYNPVVGLGNVVPRLNGQLPDRILEDRGLSVTFDATGKPVVNGQPQICPGDGSRTIVVNVPMHLFFRQSLQSATGPQVVEFTYAQLWNRVGQDACATLPVDAGDECFTTWQGTKVVTDTFTLAGQDQCPALGGPFEGCPNAIQSFVRLNTVEVGGGGTTTNEPLPGKGVHVYDRNDPLFRATYGGKNPATSQFPAIYESDVGKVGTTCITEALGDCLTGLEADGDYLAIAKHTDLANHLLVYVGRPVEFREFGKDDFAETSLQIVKELKNGVFQQYRAGRGVFVMTP